ncbi:MAG: tRNA dimethylallyltransferase, partial [Hyphomonadaceae bacterium]
PFHQNAIQLLSSARPTLISHKFIWALAIYGLEANAMIQPILILGPTASGKSKLAVQIAREIGGEIINMDSMQVYKDIPILSARPTPSEMGGIAHHLFGHIDAAHAYSTGEYLLEAKAAIDEISARGKTPILVGGTGLYAHALTQGMVETPPVPAQIRAATRKLVETDRRAAHNKLLEVDPDAAARIEVKDAIRISRALEVYEATGKSLSDWHKNPQPPILAQGAWRGFTLAPLKALGVPSFIQYMKFEISLDEAIGRSITETRQYAKRQYSWINNRAVDWEKHELPVGILRQISH